MEEKGRILLRKGTLWPAVVETTERALASGALLPIPTDYQFIEDSGVRFLVRVVTSLGLKDAARDFGMPPGSSRRANPFLPYEKELFVADVSETHVALLNKFKVVDYHLLIVTRIFEDQETLLTLRDFEALWVCMAECRGLGFYNGGEAAGASQRHKHLQMVPLPLAPGGPEVPIGPLLAAVRSEGVISVIPGLPFRHVFVRFGAAVRGAPPGMPRHAFELYGMMLETAGLNRAGGEGREKQAGPYCLLMTPEWMLLVPRSREFFGPVSINSLGFAGALLVRDDEQMRLLKERGPMHALAAVAFPPPGRP